MAKSYPDKIPAEHRRSKLRSEAYRIGWNHGHGIACHNVPTLGKTYWTGRDGKITADVDTIREVHESLCYDAAENSRSYSPFEFTAHEFNSSRNPEGVWEAFEQGEFDAISADLAEYDNDDYGIEEDDES